jgi:hypothetical protein
MITRRSRLPNRETKRRMMPQNKNNIDRRNREVRLTQMRRRKTKPNQIKQNRTRSQRETLRNPKRCNIRRKLIDQKQQPNLACHHLLCQTYR